MIKKRLIYSLLIAVLVLFTHQVSEARSKSSIEYAKSFESFFGVYHDQEQQNRINSLGQKLVKDNNLNPDDFVFKVLNSGEINAVTLPGGHIYIYKGLLDFMKTDEELAVVIGHEMGHVIGNHFAKRQRDQFLATLLGALLGGPEGAIALNAGLTSLPAYNQKDERDADDRGFEYILGSKMNPYASLVVLYKLGDLDTSGIRSNFAQHPEPLERVKRIRKYIENMNITPVVEETSNNTVIVKDGTWEFLVSQPYEKDKPIYRAWLLAGNLYCIKQKEIPQKEKFFVVESEDKAEVFYEDRLVHTICKNDILHTKESFSQKASEIIDLLHVWAEKQK